MRTSEALRLPALPLAGLALASLGLEALLGYFFALGPLIVEWLASIGLALIWLGIAVRLGPRARRPLWLFLLSGLVMLRLPLMGILPDNWCLITGRCVF